MGRINPNNSGGMEQMGEQLVEKVSSKTHIPFWGVVLVLLVILAFVLMVFYCCCQRWWKKWRGDKAGKSGLVGGKVDIRTVQLLGQTYKEKVCSRPHIPISCNFNFKNERFNLIKKDWRPTWKSKPRIENQPNPMSNWEGCNSGSIMISTKAM